MISLDTYFSVALLASHLLPILCIFSAAFLQSITGFGLVIIAAPLLMFFYDSKFTVLIMILLVNLAHIIQLPMVFRQADFKVIRWLICGAIIGQPLGFFIYYNFSSYMLKLFVSIAILAFLLTMQFSHIRIRERKRNSLGIGALSGVLTTTTGMGGPPLVMYFAYTAYTPAKLRATCIVYFLLSGICSLATFIIGGTDLLPAWHESIILLPGLVLGLLCGSAIFKYIPAALFKRLIFVILYFMCFYSIYVILK